MSFQYKIIETTELSPLEVRERILSILKYKKYRILNSLEHEVDFDSGYLLQMKWRHEPSQLTKGNFQIKVNGKLTTVELEYVISYWSNLVFLFLLIGIAICSDPGMLFLVGFLIVASCVEYFTLKREAQNLMASCK